MRNLIRLGSVGCVARGTRIDGCAGRPADAFTPLRRRMAPRLVGLITLAVGVLWGPSALGQWQIGSADGQSSLKLGFLAQGRADWIVQHVSGDGGSDWTSQNIYLRRARLLAGGKVDDRVSFFLQTDAPNLGKVAPSGTKEKEFADVYVQDLVLTWAVMDAMKVDAGLLLTPGAYNHLQSAATLLALDYGPYSFIEAAALKTKTGRDTGVSARGLLVSKHLEYRIGVYQGLRKDRAVQPFRTVGRLTVSPDPMDAGLFYPGTSFGKKKTVWLGAAFDVQGDYSSESIDLFVDYPIAKAYGLTFQGECARYDGGDLAPTIAPQTNFMIELGITGLAGRLTPFGQIARQELDRHGQDETSGQVGLAWWLDGHKANLKVGWTRFDKDSADGRDLVQVQLQAFYF